MNSLSSIALSSMNAAQTKLDTTAHNVANLATEGFKRQETVQTEQSGGGVQASVRRAENAGNALETDVVSQLQAKHSFMANLAVFKTSNKMTGVLLDTKA
ncbi:flagellar basal body protein [Rhodoferax saidenbachensis]|uniref:Flagellar basal body rod protein FlgG n=1 Tax=Rhodoferax saidenbachensis TaxID=1484693 RepID=A0ABU1ZN06_9BURK|nr:flagellar basal body protein [Rhodoferax saidenbachensis]MDR7305941.1 flagellar basal body rod protein FlgG [Rhodoferax saidenbachensis]